MNKVIAINLAGNAYQLEDVGYEHLRAYLESASAALAGNPDRDEILNDIEQAIADKFRASLEPHRNVVATKEVERVIAEMGPVEGSAPAGETPGAAAAAGPAAGAGSPMGQPTGPRRLFRIREGEMIAGVCNGIAAYLGVDVSIVRLIFALLVLLWGTGVAAYIVLAIILPVASTPEQRASAQGLPKTAQEFIRRAREGYYEGMKTWGDRRAHRAWRRKFKQDMRSWGHDFKREMKDTTFEWRRQWQARAGAAHWPHYDSGPATAVPFLWLLHVLLNVVLVFAVLSLIVHRGLWSYHVPADVPLWLAVLFLVVAFHLLCWPLRAARHACWCASGWARPYRHGTDTLAGLALFAIVLWWANRHFPEVHAFLISLPPLLHQMADSIRDWWHARR